MMQLIGKEFAARFKDAGITKIITIEASGIAPAIAAGLELACPLFLRVNTTFNLKDDPLPLKSLFCLPKNRKARLQFQKAHQLSRQSPRD